MTKKNQKPTTGTKFAQKATVLVQQLIATRKRYSKSIPLVAKVLDPMIKQGQVAVIALAAAHTPTALRRAAGRIPAPSSAYEALTRAMSVLGLTQPLRDVGHKFSGLYYTATNYAAKQELRAKLGKQPHKVLVAASETEVPAALVDARTDVLVDPMEVL